MSKKTTNQTIPPTPGPSKPRPPVVVVMGHVDHGKTTLLDFIRKTNVTARESGGITQHIGAYQVLIPHEGQDQLVTFIDTPGHEAFSSMRARGGQVADIAVLVVAADDGVMPQTKEAIAHIKAAKIPMIVAINKIDTAGANAERVKKGLADAEVLVEGYGGDVVSVPISAKTGQGVPDLLSMVLLTAEINEFRADPTAPPSGIVIESKLDKMRGPLATLIIKEGTLRLGDQVSVGGVQAKIRQMVDGFGQQVKEAGPSTPVEILGFEKVPPVGSQINVEQAEKALVEVAEVDLASLLGQEKKPDQINIILKGDVQGSIEAILGSLLKMDQEVTKLNVVHVATGEVSESDVNLARATGALVLAFRVKISPNVMRLIETQGVRLMQYEVIYKLLDDLRDALAGIRQEERPDPIGVGEVLALFPHNKQTVFGTKITSGSINRDQPAKVMRGEEEIASGRIKTIRHMKDEVPKAETGREYGILIDLTSAAYELVQAGDQILSFPKR